MTDTAQAETALADWERRTSTPLLIAALTFLILLTIPIVQPHLPDAWRRALRAVDVAIWAVFAVDYVLRLRLATRKRHFVLTHLPDLAMIALPALRPLRILRLLSLGNTLARRSANTLLADTGRAVGASAVLVVYLGAVGVLDAERDVHGANITSFGDALWWSSTTITTVGYGDRYPVTVVGRMIAVVLIVVGVALLGLLTAGIAAWFVRAATEAAAARTTRAVEDLGDEERVGQKRLDEELHEILAEMQDLNLRLADIQRRAVPSS